MNVFQGLVYLLITAQDKDINLEIHYTHGKYIPGEFIAIVDAGPDEVDPKYIRQGPKGWTVTVGDSTFSDENGEERMYPTVKEMLSAGIRLLRAYDEDRK